MDLLINTLLHLSEKIFWSMCVAVGFGMLFNTPKRALFASALLGGIGFTIKFLFLTTILPGQIVVASFAGAFSIGMLGMYFAHRVHTPPIVFTIPAVINMIPGKLGYEFMVGLITIVTKPDKNDLPPALFFETLSLGLVTTFIVMVLALGIVAPVLLFNTRTVKNKDLHRTLKKITPKPILKKVKKEE